MAARKRILVADTPEELEAELRELANAAPNSGPGPDDPGDNEAPEPDPVEIEDPEPENDEDPDPDDEDPDEGEPAIPEPAPDEPIQPMAARVYQSRIQIVDAWKYPGSLLNRPDFVDPGWASWAEYDDYTKQPAGPALRVPTAGAYAEKMCRKGDYVVRQTVTVTHSLPAESQIDVWTEAEFERLFIPAAPLAKS